MYEREKSIKLFERAVRAVGLNVETANLQPSEKERFADICNEALRTVWGYDNWGFLMESKKFEFALNEPRHIDFQVHGIDSVNLKFGCTAHDQFAGENPVCYTLRRTPRGVAVLDAKPNSVWLLYRPRRVKVSWTDWVPALYDVGDVVFYNGDSWRCVKSAASVTEAPSAAPEYWERQDVPEVFSDYIVGCVALTRLQGDDAAVAAERTAATLQLGGVLEQLAQQHAIRDNHGGKVAVEVAV